MCVCVCVCVYSMLLLLRVNFDGVRQMLSYNAGSYICNGSDDCGKGGRGGARIAPPVVPLAISPLSPGWISNNIGGLVMLL